MIQGGYFKPPAEDASTKEWYVHSVLVSHQRWARALETDKRMSQQFEASLKVRKTLLSKARQASQSHKKKKGHKLVRIFRQIEEKRRLKKEKANARKAAKQAERAEIRKAAEDIKKRRREEALAEAEKVIHEKPLLCKKSKQKKGK